MTLPPMAQQAWGHLPHIRQVGRYEYCSACPQCGESEHVGPGKPDRFRIFTDNSPRAWCRRCGYFAFADAVVGTPPSAQKIAEMERERARLSEAEARRIQQRILKLQSEAYWRGWHDAMDERHRAAWRDEGIPDSLQDMHELGYAENKEFWSDSGEFKTDALTIPYFTNGRQLANVQYKLRTPPRPGDKYRFTSGLPAPLYLTDDVPVAGKCLLVEGAKKAIITHGHMFDRYDCVVGLPGKHPSRACLDSLKDCNPIFYAADPDAVQHGEAAGVAEYMTREHNVEVRIAHLVAKPDDLFTQHKMTAPRFERLMSTARRWS
jgi:hypothetical protein